MIKTDYGRLSAPYFEDTLDNGLNVCFFPRNSKLQSALLYVPSGAYLHVDSIDSVKIPSSTGYLVKETLFGEKTREEFLDDKVLAKTLYDYSYTGYQMTSYEDIFPSIQLLMKKIRALDFTEEEIESFKKSYAAKEESDPIAKVEKAALNQLYFESPLKDGLLPSSDGLKSIHRSTVRKYLGKYYRSSNLTLFVSLDASPSKVLEELRQVKAPGKLELPSRERVISEPEDIKAIYGEIHGRCKRDYVTFGIKLPSRKALYERYGQLLFCFYEILLPSLFTENEEFLSGLRTAKAELVDAKLNQGYEEACILLTFAVESSTPLISFVNSYLANPSKHIGSKNFKRNTTGYYQKGLRTLSSPVTALEAFAKAEADRISYTALISSVSKLSYGSYARFVDEEIGKAKRTSCHLIHQK